MASEANKIIYSMIKVSKKYNQKQILKDISLSYFYGAKIGVLGLNGSGKSTLLRILAGIDREHEGKTILSEGFTIDYLPQEPTLDPEKTVREVVEEGAQATVDLLNEFNAINEQFAEPMDDDAMQALIDRQAQVQDKLDAVDAWNLDSRLEMAMDALRCPPADMRCGVLSGGEQRRVALCRILLKNPDILLLDEPTNHLDAESVAWLEHHLQQYPGTVIAVTHDRYFLDNVAGWILELDRGQGIPWKGNYSSWLEQKQKRLAQEEKKESERQRTLGRELEWIRMSPKGRRTKAKARITAYENLLNQQSEKASGDLEIYIPPGPRLGKLVIEAQGVRKAYVEDRLLVDNLSFPAARRHRRHRRPERRRQDHPVPHDHRPGTAGRGHHPHGETVKLAYVDQSRDALDPAKTIYETISDGQDHLARHPRGQRLRLRGPVQLHRQRPAAAGGRDLRRPAQPGASRAHAQGRRNVLLLDEPTNDLDEHHARPGRGPGELRRPRRGHQPRPLVPSTASPPTSWPRGRLRGHLVRGQPLRLRAGLQAPQGARRGPAAPHPLPPADSCE